MNVLNTAVNAEALLLHAERLLDDRRIGEALNAFHASETVGADPDRCSAGRWMCFMLLGDFEAAWVESDAIRQRGRPDEHRFWNGEDIRGQKVIVRCLHGLGDTIQMLRYAPQLRALCAELIVEVPPALLETATWLDGVDRAITWGELAPAQAPEWNVQIEVTELPYLFRTQLSDLPIADHYLHLPSAGSWQPVIRGDRPRIGVVWAAGEWNPTRSVPFNRFRHLLRFQDVQYWNLQGGSHADEWACVGSHANLRDAREFGGGLAVLASVISQMDLVITVDTLAAHMAGALGVPAWVLLQHAADWRWMLDTATSPWYSSLRLYRQVREGDWSPVLREVIAELERWIPQTKLHHLG